MPVWMPFSWMPRLNLRKARIAIFRTVADPTRGELRGRSVAESSGAGERRRRAADQRGGRKGSRSLIAGVCCGKEEM